MVRKNSYDPRPIYHVRGNGELLADLRNRLGDEALEPLNDAIQKIAGELSGEVEGLDYWAARLIVSALAVDAAKTLQVVATADARDSGIPVLTAAQALGYSSATPLQRDGDLIRKVQAARKQATATREAVSVEVVGGWSFKLPPDEITVTPPEEAAYDEQDYGLEPQPSEEIPKPTRDLSALEAEFAEARRSAKRGEKS